jgi:hypothetical protein
MNKKKASSVQDELKMLKDKYQKKKQTNKEEINTTNNTNNKTNGEDNRHFKFKNMSNLIFNKIDDILGQNSHNILNNDFFIDSTKDIISQLESSIKSTDYEPILDISTPSAVTTIEKRKLDRRPPSEKNIEESVKSTTNASAKELPKMRTEMPKDIPKSIKPVTTKEQPKIINPNDNNKNNNTKAAVLRQLSFGGIENNHIKVEPIKKEAEAKKEEGAKQFSDKNTFMTDLDLIAREEQRAHDDYQRYHDKKIKDVLSTLDELDDEFTSGELGDPDLDREFRKEVTDIKKLFDELDTVKKDKKEEFDELQYLIKMVNNTQNSVERHIKGVSNVYSTKPSTNKLNTVDEDDDDDYYTANNDIIISREKNISKIKNNIFNIQDNVFSFYDNFKKNFKIK